MSIPFVSYPRASYPSDLKRSQWRMEELFKFELGFITAIFALITGMWQISNHESYLFKYLFFIIGGVSLILAFLWIDYLKNQMELIPRRGAKITHYFLLALIQYTVFLFGILIFSRADVAKRK